MEWSIEDVIDLVGAAIKERLGKSSSWRNYIDFRVKQGFKPVKENGEYVYDEDGYMITVPDPNQVALHLQVASLCNKCKGLIFTVSSTRYDRKELEPLLINTANIPKFVDLIEVRAEAARLSIVEKIEDNDATIQKETIKLPNPIPMCIHQYGGE